MNLLLDTLLAASVLVLWLLLLASAGFGLLALLNPSKAERLQQLGNQRISTRRALKWAEWPHRIERAFYRHHRAYGSVLLTVTLISLWVLWQTVAPQRLVDILAAGSAHRLWLDIVLTSLYWLLLLGMLLAALLSTLVIVRPSLLKTAERYSNRWISTRQAGRRLERSSEALDQQFLRCPRLAGGLLLVASLMLLLLLWPLTRYLLHTG